MDHASTHSPMVNNALGWGGDPSHASYAALPLTQHPPNLFEEPQVLGSAPFVSTDPFHFEPPYGIMSQEHIEQSQSKPPPAILPQPQHILASQTIPKACLACGKMECPLVSHKHFSKHVLTNSKNRSSLPVRSQQQSPAHQVHGPPIPSEPAVQYPMVMDQERQQLLSLWSREWSRLKRGPERHLFPIRFIDRVLPAAKGHAPLFQSLLALSATLWAQANNIVDEVAPRQLAFAVQMLSQACPTEQTASTDASMLAAILILLVYLAQGNGFEVGKHISGLVHLTALRGGLHYLGMGGLLAEMLMYADHTQAVFFDQEPVWKLPMPPLDIGLPSRFGRGFQELMRSNEVDMPLLTAAVSLCKVADMFQHTSMTQDTLPADARNAFGYLSTISEYQLAQCNARYHQSSSRNECVCLSLILFNQIVLRNDGAITPAIRKVEYQFWTLLEAADTRSGLLDMPPRLLVWMILTGLTVSVRSECQWRSMAVGKLRVVRATAAILSWDHLVSNVLEYYVWFSPAQEELFKHVWMEVEGLKTMPTTAGIG